MIKFRQGLIVYYFGDQAHLDACKRSIDDRGRYSTIQLMSYCDFAVDVASNLILKNRNIELESMVDKFLGII